MFVIIHALHLHSPFALTAGCLPGALVAKPFKVGEKDCDFEEEEEEKVDTDAGALMSNTGSDLSGLFSASK